MDLFTDFPLLTKDATLCGPRRMVGWMNFRIQFLPSRRFGPKHDNNAGLRNLRNIDQIVGVAS